MSQKAKFRSDLRVEYVGHYGSDQLIARRAWVLEPGQQDSRDDCMGWAHVIKSMMKHEHTTPFEGGLLDIYMEVPAVVWWQLTRHRFMSAEVEDFSFDLESGRYRVLDGEFYIPPQERKLIEPEGFKPMRPILASASVIEADHVKDSLLSGCDALWGRYQKLIDMGCAREVARLLLPFSIYYAGYVSARPSTWLHYFKLRISGGKVASFPQWEIEQVAMKCSDIFRAHWPLTHLTFLEVNGRL